MSQAAKDAKKAAKTAALKQVHAELNEIVRRFNAARQVACQQTGMDYRNQGTAAAPFFEPALPNALGKQAPDTGRTIHAGQARANGKDLAPLPRYSA